MRKNQNKEPIEFVTIPELRKHELFANLPYKYLEYHDRTVVRRSYPKLNKPPMEPEEKDPRIVCKEGDYGATAYLIIEGELEVIVEAPSRIEIVDQEHRLNPEEKPPAAASRPEIKPIIRTKEDKIIGEMSCLSHHPRTATIQAKWDSDCEIWEIRRNFLDALRRNRGSREILEEMYKKRAIPDLLHRAKLFASLPDAERAAIVSFLQPRVDLIRVDPGQIVFEQGQVADHFYLVRQGFVKVARKAGKDEIVLDYLGPQTQFGEIGLLTADTVNYLDNDEKAALPLGFLNGTRSATVSALDEVEVVQITGEDFYYMAQQYPTFKKRVIEQAKEYLEKNQRNLSTIGVESLSEATEKGIFNANNLLVIDLEKCTRCDECSKACADNHGGVSRLKRDGMRYGHYLVTTTCRSCQNPYCMAGCPVDAIHRKPSLDGREGQEIVIEAWCIGCGRCEQNCPYGNISMQDYIVLESGQPGEDGNKAPVRLQSYRPNLKARIKLATLKVLSRFSSRFKVTRKARKRAVTCDLCRDVCHKKGQEVACVHACPHDAAHRLSGPKLIDLVRERSTI